MEVGDLVWVFNAQSVRQLPIVEININVYGNPRYMLGNGSIYYRHEMGWSKLELAEHFFGDIGNLYRHKLV